MRHAWAFFNAQVVKEMDLYMLLKISRTTKLVHTYFEQLQASFNKFSGQFNEVWANMKRETATIQPAPTLDGSPGFPELPSDNPEADPLRATYSLPLNYRLSNASGSPDDHAKNRRQTLFGKPTFPTLD